MRRIAIRLRLTLAAAVSSAIVLAVVGGYVYRRVESRLDAGVAQTLRQRAADVGSLAAQADTTLSEARAGGLDSDEIFAEILTTRGTATDSTPATGGASLAPPSVLAKAAHGSVTIDRTAFAGRHLRVLVTPATIDGHRRLIAVGMPLEDRDQALGALAGQLLLALPTAVLVITVGAWLLAGAALRPVRDLAGAADAISRTGRDQRLPEPPTRDEIAALAATLNRMLERLEDAARRERRFIADASHELRTPLALLTSELEVALRGPRRVPLYETALRDATRTVDGLAQLADNLLLLARADEQALRLHPESVDPRHLATGLARRFVERAAALHREIAVDTETTAPFAADPVRLVQALTNLVENALRHGAGQVTIRVRDDGDQVLIGVHDDGSGPPSPFLPILFDRFTRADAARGPAGTGLGLAIVAVIAAAHGGDTYTANGDGFEVGIRIPGNGQRP